MALATWTEPDLKPAAVVSLHTPLGELFVAATDDSVIASGFEEGEFLRQLTSNGYEALLMGAGSRATDLAEAARTELMEYFDGDRMGFDVPVATQGATPFATAVLTEVTKGVPFGQTATYGEIGERVGRLRAARAVGTVMSTCAFTILIPCHRVIHSGQSPNGSLPAEVSPRHRKAWLLRFEREVSP